MKKILIAVFLIVNFLSCSNKNNSKKGNELWGRLDETTKKEVLRKLSHEYSALHKECRVIELTVSSTDDVISLEFHCGNSNTIQKAVSSNVTRI